MSNLRHSFSAINESEKHLQYLCCIMNFYMYADPSIQSSTKLMYLMFVIFHSIRGSWLIQSYFTKIFFISTPTKLITAESKENNINNFFPNRNNILLDYYLEKNRYTDTWDSYVILFSFIARLEQRIIGWEVCLSFPFVYIV